MALLDEAVESKKFDTRVVERNVQRGVVRPEDVQKSLSSLPDDAENATYVNIESLAADGSEDANGSVATHH
jgi:hypothetical protein